MDYEQTPAGTHRSLDDQDLPTEKAARMRYILGRFQKCSARYDVEGQPSPPTPNRGCIPFDILGAPTARGYDRRPFSSSQTAPYLARLCVMFLAQMRPSHRDKQPPQAPDAKKDV